MIPDQLLSRHKSLNGCLWSRCPQYFRQNFHRKLVSPHLPKMFTFFSLFSDFFAWFCQKCSLFSLFVYFLPGFAKNVRFFSLFFLIFCLVLPKINQARERKSSLMGVSSFFWCIQSRGRDLIFRARGAPRVLMSQAKHNFCSDDKQTNRWQRKTEEICTKTNSWSKSVGKYYIRKICFQTQLFKIR